MQTLTTAQLKEMTQRNRSFVLVNVLPEETFKNEHIPGSHNVPVALSDFEDRVETLTKGKDQAVVVYCADKDCTASAKAAQKLDRANYKTVYDYEAGMKGWKNAGLQVSQA